ncbi:porin [Larsenimonas suaedae]|uniref:Porin n=1 Tax=Larsenimonas suaedae TaxID=1851019 RepID=A0ABU1GWE0_9GAMM|nr:porin [Larsenimonas suaedae]MCM2972933.1 porin [Larsenimonas suaedae]MDR5896370.1 porin [Larsenimonas suaedae]
MKKTLLATAIAGVLGVAATGAQAATVYNQDGSKLDLYGNVQLGLRNIDNGDSTESDLFDNGSTLGVKGEHVLDNGLTAYFRAEFEFEADKQKGAYANYESGDGGNNSGLTTGDQAYVGLTGNFGDLRVGSWDSLFDDWIADPVSNNEYFDMTDEQSDLVGSEYESDKITYTSPMFGGLQFAIGTQYKGDGEAADNSPVNNDLNDGTGQFVLDDDSSASLFGGLRYTVGGLTLAASYDNLNNFKFQPGTGGERDYGDLFGLNVAYTINTLRVAVKASRLDADWNDNADVNRYGIGARWGYGKGDIYGAYQYVDAEGDAVATLDPRGFNGIGNQSDETYNEAMIGATYNLSNQMYVWVEGAVYDRQDDANNGVATGVAYSF